MASIATDANVKAVIGAEIVRRRRAIAAVILINDLKRKSELRAENPKRKLWSREWLLRRDKERSVLNMVFEELGPTSSSSSTTNSQEEDFVFQRPGIVSSVPSTSSSSGICAPSTRKKKHARLDPHSQEYIRAVEAIAKSVSEPINVNFDDVQNSLMDSDHSFAMFLTSLFRRFKNFDLKMEVMQNVMQTVTNALVVDRERSNN